MTLYPEDDGIERFAVTRLAARQIAALQERIAELRADRNKWRIEAGDAIEAVKFANAEVSKLREMWVTQEELAQARAIIEAQAQNLAELREALSAMLDFTESESVYGFRDRSSAIRKAHAALEGVEPE